MSINYIISETRNSRIGQIILIGDRTTLLDYDTSSWNFAYNGYWLQTRTSFCCYLHRVLE